MMGEAELTGLGSVLGGMLVLCIIGVMVLVRVFFDGD